MPTKRGNSEGNIRKRTDGRWEARITLADGKRKSFFAKTRQEAAKMLVAATRDRDAGLPVVGGGQTLAQYLATWLETVRPSLKAKAFRSYEQLTRVHVLPTLGRTPLTKVTPQQLQWLYATRLEAGSSTTTVHHVHTVLHTALEAGLRLGLVQRNVCDLVDPPRMRHYEIHVLTPAQVQILLQASQGHRLEALFFVALATGMRQGELLALKWQDVDLERGHLTVRATLQRNRGGGFVLVPPKTKRSRRRVVLPTVAIQALIAHRKRQDIERQTLGMAWDEQGFVFTNRLGRPLDGIHVLRRALRPLLLRAGLPPIRFHDLRHTAATLLLIQGVNPKVVSEVLGHSNVSITLEIYSHVLPDLQRLAADAMNDVLDPADDN